MGGVIVRPFRVPEAVWAVGGAVLLVLAGLMPAGMALAATASGSDVYLFLTGMMLLSETARAGGLFDWAAATAVNHANGSRARLFALIFATGTVAAGASGVILALVSNLMNNLPAGLIASLAIQRAHAPPPVIDALLIGADLGPNLSVTGSLATILWLPAIRREGEDVGFWRFLKVGAATMPPALLAALAARLLLG